MSKEDNTKKPQFVIPESAESKPVNKLLVPNEVRITMRNYQNPNLSRQIQIHQLEMKR